MSQKACILAVLAVVAALNAQAATVGLDDLEVAVGINEVIAMPVHISVQEAEEVAACQFDLQVDPVVFSFIGLTAGDAAVSAAKTVSCTPLDSGTLRVMVQGLNLNTINTGHLATVSLFIPGGTLAGSYDVNVGNLVCSDPYGTTLPAQAQSALVVITQIPLPAAGALALFSAIAATALLARPKRNSGCQSSS